MTATRGRVRLSIRALACIPVFDCILNQINNALHITLGSLSLLQTVRIPLLVALAGACLWRIVTRRGCLSALSYAAPAVFALVGTVIAKELLDTETLAFSSLIAYGQLLYWVTVWSYVCIECRNAEEATVLLYGVAAGSLLSAGSIVLGYCAGGLNPYTDDGVIASAGWFNTAKTITGVLLSGAIILLYLGSKRTSPIYQLLAIVCCACCILTYARAGQVALGLVIVWLLFWCISPLPHTGSKTVIRFLAFTALLAAITAPAVLRSQSFIARWEDVRDGENGGSGRAAFWRVAIEDYRKARPAEALFGVGFDGMSEMLYSDYGTDIRHTHNDCLDMMLVGGVCGILWWAALLIALGRSAARQIRSAEGFASVGLFLVFVCHGQLTGQLWGTDSMVAYTVGLASLAAIKRNRQRTCATFSTTPVRRDG